MLASSENILFFDDFSSNLSQWTVESGHWTIDSGNLLTKEIGILFFQGDISAGSNNWDNYIIEYDVQNELGVDNEIVFRRSQDKYYTFNLRHGTGLHDTPEIKLFKNIDGIDTLLRSTHNQQLLNNVWYKVRIEVLGENIKLRVNNNLIFDLTDTGTTIKKGGIGFQSWTGANGFIQTRYDNLKIISLNKTPLVIIPGIGGSELKVAVQTNWSAPNGHGGIFSNNYTAGETVWVNQLEAIKPGNDDYFDILRMKSDGINSEANLELTGNLFSGAYQGTIDFFIENGYTLNQDLFVFPYDWRKDLSLTKPLLDQKISEIKTQTGASKVDILSHSMGGLVARNYIADPAKAQNVRKLFTLGTPHLGSVDFLKQIKYGGCFTRPDLQGLPFCLGLTNNEVKDVLQNLIGGFQLSPSQTYYSFYSGESNLHPLPFADLADIDSNGTSGYLNYSQLKTLLTNLGHNTGLFTPSETFHNLDPTLANTNDVNVTNITGSGLPTLGQIVEKYAVDFLGIKIPHRDELLINGDKTVPLFSSSLNDPSKNLSLLGNAKLFYTKQEHGSLSTSGSALELVKNLLSDDSALPIGVATEHYQLNGHQLSVHSPVNLHIYDSFGNHTGPTSDPDSIGADEDFETNIPGSTYDTLDDAKFIWLSEEGVYSIIFESTGQGSFDFKIRQFEDDLITQTILYKDIPLQPNTVGETQYNTLSDQPPVLQIDNAIYNYFSILEGDDNYDYTDPEISFEVNPKSIWPPNNEMVDVNIVGNIIDENPYLTTITVEDEYNLVEPAITTYYQTAVNQTMQLEASRRGDDQNGRTYLIRILVTDLAGNSTQQQLEVVVPHDQK